MYKENKECGDKRLEHKEHFNQLWIIKAMNRVDTFYES